MRVRRPRASLSWRQQEAAIAQDYPCVKQFMRMRETASPLVDTISGENFTSASVGTSYWPGQAVRVQGTLNSSFTDWYWQGEDILLISCARWVGDGDIGAYLYQGHNDHVLRLHTYFAIFGNTPSGTPSRMITTKQNEDNLCPFDVGDDLVCAAGKNGSLLTHIAPDLSVTTVDTDLLLTELDGSMSDDIPTSQANMLTLYNYWNGNTTVGYPNTYLQLGHGGHGLVDSYEAAELVNATEYGAMPHLALRSGTPNTYEVAGSFTVGGSFTTSQDYYGIMLCAFQDGWPGDAVVQAAVKWCSQAWPLGIKLPPPHFRGIG